jgi:hypothetical protein
MALFIPLDGRIPSQNPLPAPITDGSAVMEIVSPGNNDTGNTYKASLNTLAAFFAAFPFLNSELITAGATSGSPYPVQPNDTRILFKKTLGSASFAVCPLAASMVYGQTVFFKDIKGDARTNNITVTFTGGELCDGQSQMKITNNYGWFAITPVPGGGAWYQSQ